MRTNHKQECECGCQMPQLNPKGWLILILALVIANMAMYGAEQDHRKAEHKVEVKK
jgi:hypothetical protein